MTNNPPARMAHPCVDPEYEDFAQPTPCPSRSLLKQEPDIRVSLLFQSFCKHAAFSGKVRSVFQIQAVRCSAGRAAAGSLAASQFVYRLFQARSKLINSKRLRNVINRPVTRSLD